MQEINVEELNPRLPDYLLEIKQRAIKGVLALSGRTFILQIIAFIGFFLLTIFLDQQEIGLFFAISELVAVLGYFSDIGLAASLIQKKEKPSNEEIKSTFTFQQILVISLILIVVTLSPFLQRFYSISPEGMKLFWALLAGFFLASLKTIPSVLLERELKFNYLVLVEITETFLFYLISVLLAWRRFGVLSYAVAVLARGIAGVILIYFIQRWEIGFNFDFKVLKNLFNFGVPYQLNTLLAVIKDRLMNVVLWRIIQASGVGFLGWAQKWSQVPLRFFMDPVMKVTFPAYSRMQENKQELKKAIEKTLFFVSLLTFPTLTGMAVLIKPFVLIIPKYQKWEPAILAFILCIVSSAWAAVTTPLTNALAAVGKIKVVFKLMIMWTVLTWIFYPILGLKMGYNGVALASTIVACSSMIAIWVAKKILDFDFWKSISKPLFSSLLMGLFLYFLNPFFGEKILGLFFLIISGFTFYLGLIFLMLGNSFLKEILNIYLIFKKNEK